MPLVISLAAKTAITATFDFAGLAADGTIDLQIGPKPDFEFCVAPIGNIPRATPYQAVGLNQQARLFARARSRRASGVVEDWSNIVGFQTDLAAAQNLAVPSILMDRAVIMRPEPVIQWVGGHEVAGFPAKNLGRDAPVAWRSISAGGGSHFVHIEHAGAPVDTIAILNTNLPEAMTLNVRTAATLAGLPAGEIIANAVPFRASANVPGRNGYHGLVRLAAPVSSRFLRIAFLPTPVFADQLHVEHVLIGLNRASKNIALEKNETAVHLGSKERTRAGNPDLVKGLKMRRVEFDLAWLTETQSETLYQDVMGWLDEPVFAIPNSKAGPYLHDRMVYGDLKGGRIVQPSSLHFTRTFTIDSLI